VDPTSGANVYFVPPSYFPNVSGGRILGWYVPSTHEIYVSNDLSGDQLAYVYHHEVGHARGDHTEAGADAYARSIVGYDAVRRAA